MKFCFSVVLVPYIVPVKVKEKFPILVGSPEKTVMFEVVELKLRMRLES